MLRFFKSPIVTLIVTGWKTVESTKGKVGIFSAVNFRISFTVADIKSMSMTLKLPCFMSTLSNALYTSLPECLCNVGYTYRYSM